MEGAKVEAQYWKYHQSYQRVVSISFEYVTGIVVRNQKELQMMDRKTRKPLMIPGGFNPKSDVDRLYVPRNKGGQGLMGIEETVWYEEQSLFKYIDRKTEDIMVKWKPTWKREETYQPMRLNRKRADWMDGEEKWRMDNT